MYLEKIVVLENLKIIAEKQEAKIIAMWPEHFRAAQSLAIDAILKRQLRPL